MLALAFAATIVVETTAAVCSDEILEDRVVEAFGRGDLATAERLLLELLATDPRHPEHLYNLACAKSLQGDPEAAIGRLLEAVDSGFRDARFLGEDRVLFLN